MKTPTPVQKYLKVAAPLFALMLALPAQATVFTYNTNNGTSNWSAASSWDTGVGPNGVGAVLSRTASANVTLAQDIASVTVGTITLASNCLWTINTGTNQLILDGGGSGAVIENASTGAGASLMLTTSTSSSFVIADDLLIKQSDANSTASGTAATARYAIQLNQRLVGTKSITITNVLNDLNYGLVCFGGGNTAAGTYTGAITVAKGALTWTSNTAFGSTSGITLGSTGGGDVSFVSVTNVASVGPNITVAANTGGKTVLGSILATGVQKFGNVALNQGLTVISQMTTADTAGVELNGVVSGTGGLQINGTVTISKVSTDTTGIVKISGTNTFTGDTRVYKGTLLLGAASTGTNSLALQYSTLNLDAADSGTVGFGLNSSTTINSATLGGLSGSRDLALQNINTTSKAVALSVGKNNTDTTYTGALTGAGSLTKIGTGTLTLGGINTYSGQTKVNSGQLNLTGTSTSSAFTVSASAGLKINGSLVGTVTSAGVVSGTGAISGATIITGTLAPGNSVGTINTGDLSLAGGGTLAVELGRNESNVAVSDLASVNGAVDLTGANLQLQVYTGYTNPLVGDIYFLINNDGKTDAITGTFTTLDGVAANLIEGSRFTWNSQEWEITYTANYDTQTLTGGNDLAIIAVPEPGTWAMVLGGLGTLLAGQRLRRRS